MLGEVDLLYHMEEETNTYGFAPRVGKERPERIEWSESLQPRVRATND